MFFGIDLIVIGWWVVGWDRKSYLGAAEIASFSSWDLRQHNKHDSFWLSLSTGYFYILFLWAIIASDFLPLFLPLTSITFTTNSQADNHFYKYIYVSNIIQYEISLLLKYTLRFFIFKLDLNVKHCPHFF